MLSKVIKCFPRFEKNFVKLYKEIIKQNFRSGNIFLLIDFRERKGRGREKEICCSTYLCVHWLTLVCAVTRDRTHNLGIWERCSNQLSYLARSRSGNTKVRHLFAPLYFEIRSQAEQIIQVRLYEHAKETLS
ncbi:hypothetical protein HJG60_010685 [Phyllostomus discolor]|uniref:Uncharacterized protein n=1 Tax=Phyllostomus discolor TaxID=89673 RepID=A0A834ARV3_9CHIR|nr:hypothetical protein HJG60_010685 [Phyllostomus discolor]